MKSIRTKIFGVLLLLWIGLACSPLATAASVGIEPTQSTFSVGETFSLNIVASDVIDLYGFQFDIAFNPSILAAQSIAEGAFLSSGGATFFIPGTIDNVAGLISFNADTLIGEISGMSGSGILALLDFSAVGVGVSSINLSSPTLLDSNFQNITADIVAGSVQVQAQGGSVPEPASLWLVVPGIGWLTANRRSRRFADEISKISKKVR